MAQFILDSVTITSYQSGPHMSGFHFNHSTGTIPYNIQLLCPKCVIVNKVTMTYNKCTGRVKHVIFSSDGKLLITCLLYYRFVNSNSNVLQHYHTFCPTQPGHHQIGTNLSPQSELAMLLE